MFYFVVNYAIKQKNGVQNLFVDLKRMGLICKHSGNEKIR
jgi:hypothetical protein